MTRRPIGLVIVAVVLAAACSDDGSTAPSSSIAVPPTTESAESGTVPGSEPATAVAAGDTYVATIRRTTGGVPHIVADDLPSVFFGQGYASAEDHGCTLADQMLRVQGRRSEYFGAGDDDINLDSDIAWRALGIDATARGEYPDSTPIIIDQFEGFAAGWSAYLAEAGDLTGWCAGADWVQPLTGVDIYSYARTIALNASSGRLTSFIATAQPPAPAPAGAAPTDTTAGASGVVPDAPLASNGWAIGADRTTGGTGGMLVANPHFPWEGELRFWEVQLTVPGQLDIYGAQLLGLPGVGIGFTDAFAWTHTVSAGKRFTAYTLDLDPADPTAYMVDGESRPMDSTVVTVAVLQDDGTTTDVERTMWSTEYGPVIDFPGVGWTTDMVLTYRDTNLDNEEFIDQYAAMDTAASLDEFIDAHRTYQGVPLFNTIAVSSDGRAWYADTSATPNLSDEAEAAYLEALAAGGLAKVAADNGVVLLDGSNSLYQWRDVPGARDPGLVPFDEMPMTERSDYVFNANDSYWLSNAEHLLTGDYSILHGRADVAVSARTRENATLLADTTAAGPAGPDGTFTGDELRDLVLGNEGYTARALREPVVERCADATVVEVPELLTDDGTVALPADTVDVSAACDVLAAWDGVYDIDSVGAALWREFLARIDLATIWAVPFDPTDPVGTPSGLAAPIGAGADPVLIGLAQATQLLTKAGFGVDVALGDVQFTDRSGTRIKVHGGGGSDGTTNIVTWSSGSSSTEPAPVRGDRLAPRSSLTADGYPINYGTSFVMVVDFSSGAPAAWSLLTYGETGDRTSPLFETQTLRFSEKDWKEVAFSEAAIAADPAMTTVTVTAPRG
ncbi:MAG: penicillin acylase family protein [Actinomycetota bacterium]|nr:MAG: putative acylase [Acidimicrobiaceae bacterium]